MDGTYFQSWGLLVPTDGHHVIDWQWCDREKKIAWLQILEWWPAPKMVILDGGTGLHAALHQRWPETKVQRCYFHIFHIVCRHLTLRPRLEFGCEILTLTKALMKVYDLDQAVAWLSEYAAWENRWDTFLKQRTYARENTDRPSQVPMDRPWRYTHRDLRKTRGLYRNLIRTGSLFTWLDPDLQPSERPPTRRTALPRTTSSLEGGPNKALKDLFRTHRGLPVDHARRAAE